jgi:hypothetical protein
MMDPLSASDANQVANLKQDLCVGYEFEFDIQTPPNVVLRLLLDFFTLLPPNYLVHLECKAYLTILRNLFEPSSASADSLEAQRVAALLAFLNSMDTVSRRVFIEVVHIVGVLIDNSSFNMCDPLALANCVAEVIFMQPYQPVASADERGSLDPQAYLLLWCTSQRAQMVRMWRAPLLGAKATDALLLQTVRAQFPDVRDGAICAIACTAKHLWCGSANGVIRILDRRTRELVRMVQINQPLVSLVSMAGDVMWVRGEMRPEVRNATGEVVVKPARNGRCFVFLDELQQMWAGAEGAVHVLDCKTGVLVKSLSLESLGLSNSQAAALVSPTTTSTKTTTLTTSTTTRTTTSIGGAKSSSPKIPIKFMVRCGDTILAACGGGAIVAFDCANGNSVAIPLPTSTSTSTATITATSTATVANSLGEWTGLVGLCSAGVVGAVGVTATGWLVTITKSANAQWEWKSLKSTHNSLRNAVLCGSDWVISSAGRDLIAFSLSRWCQGTVVRSPSEGVIGALLSQKADGVRIVKFERNVDFVF